MNANILAFQLTTIPHEIYIDDDMGPTTTEVMRLWETGADNSDMCARAVVRVIADNPKCLTSEMNLDALETCLLRAQSDESSVQSPSLSKISALCFCLGGIAEIRKDLPLAENYLQRALEIQRTLWGNMHDQTQLTMQRLLALFEKQGRTQDANKLRQTLYITGKVRDCSQNSLLELRTKALELYVNEEYEEAEEIYLSLIAAGFELGSTHCHLARIYFATNRDQKAAEETELAWNYRDSSPSYVKPRVRFFRLLGSALSGTETENFVNALENELGEPGTRLVWTIQPVIDKLQPRLTESSYLLLTTLAGKLQGIQSDMPVIDANPQSQASDPMSSDEIKSVAYTPFIPMDEIMKLQLTFELSGDGCVLGLVISVAKTEISVKSVSEDDQSTLPMRFLMSNETKFDNPPNQTFPLQDSIVLLSWKKAPEGMVAMRIAIIAVKTDLGRSKE